MATENGKKPLPYDPTVAVFLVELALCRGNASEASRNIGWHETRGRRLVADHPELRGMANRIGERIADSLADGEIGEWTDMHMAARRTIRDLLNSDHDPTRLRAAELVIERVEGKVTQPVRDEMPPVDRNSVTMRFIASLHMYRNVTVAEAMNYADRNPEAVEEWGRARGLIREDGGESFDA